jgi:hypothetical protein
MVIGLMAGRLEWVHFLVIIKESLQVIRDCRILQTHMLMRPM